MENNNYEVVTVELPEKVMKHARLAAREIVRAELSYLESAYDDVYEFDEDEFQQVIMEILIPKMLNEIPTAFEEVCKEMGLYQSLKTEIRAFGLFSFCFIFALKTSPIMEEEQKGWINMDEMKIKLSTRLMRGFVSKLLAKMIYKKTGYKVNIQINELDVKVIDGEANLSTNLEVKIDNDEFLKIIKSIGLD